MSHLASAESDPAFTQLQVERFREATAGLGSLRAISRTAPPRFASLEARFDAVRCGIALYGISPFGSDPADDGLEPVLRWESYVDLVRSSSRARAPATDGGSSLTGRPGSASCQSGTRTGSVAT